MNYEITMLFRDVTVRIESSSNKRPIFRVAGDVSGNEVAALHAMAEILSCLSNGKELGPHFNPTVDHAEEDRVVKCKWERSGNLTVIGPADRHHLHAETVKEAIDRARVFTTTNRIVKQLPIKRVS